MKSISQKKKGSRQGCLLHLQSWCGVAKQTLADAWQALRANGKYHRYLSKNKQYLKKIQTVFETNSDIYQQLLEANMVFEELLLARRLKTTDQDEQSDLGIKQFHTLLKVAYEVIKSNTQLRADAYVANENTTLLAAVALKKHFGGKLIWYVKEHPLSTLQRTLAPHCYYDLNISMMNIVDSIIHLLVKEVDCCCCTGQGYADYLTRAGINAVNVNRLREPQLDNVAPCLLKAEFNIDVEQQLALAYPGNIYLASDFMQVLKLMAKLPENTRLIHLGDFANPRLAAEIRYYIYSMGLSERVILAGFQPRTKMLQILSACHIGIVHLNASIESNRLSLHNRFADLIAAGLPFIYSNNESMSGLAQGNPGACEYDWLSGDDMLKKIEDLLSHLDEAKKAIRLLQPYFSPDTVQAQLEPIFANVQTLSFVGHANLQVNLPTVQLIDYLLKQNKTVNLCCSRKINNARSKVLRDDNVDGARLCELNWVNLN